VLLPGADVDDRGLHARLDRLERRLGIAEGASTNVRPEPSTLRPEPVEGSPSERASTSSAHTSRPEPVEGPPSERTSTSAVLSSSKGPARISSAPEPAALHPEPVEGHPGQASEAPTDTTQPPQLTVTDVRRLWPEVLEEVKGKRRFTWILLSQNAQVAELRNGTLLLAMSNTGARDSFARGGNEDVLREAIVVVMGADFAVETMVDPSATSSDAASRTSQAVPPAAGPAPSAPDTTTRTTNGAPNAIAEDPDAAASRDDSDLDENAESQTQLLARHLGAEIIAEEDHGA
jgi:DNA polymerase III subunit gamma/tau